MQCKINSIEFIFFYILSYNIYGDYMKQALGFLIACIFLFNIYWYRKPLTEYFLLNFVYKNDFKYEQVNSYKKQQFSYYKQTDNYLPKNEQDIENIIYSALNNGQTYFNFFCSYKYGKCSNDVKKLINNGEKLSNINNFVSPFNSYNKLDISINNFGLVTVKVINYYDDAMIDLLNKEVDRIINELITNDMSDYDKVLTIHDYIIDHSVYDQEKEDNLYTNTSYNSDLAIGPLLQGHGICSGYSDALSLFLDKLNIPNYRISSNNHIWNLVYINNNWYHIDITWDDPIVNTGEQIINHNYFMISTDELQSEEDKEKIKAHIFDETIYLEAKKA